MGHSVVLLQQSSFLSVFGDPVSVSLLVLEVTLSGRSRDFVDPRLLSLHLRPATMDVEVLAHAIWISRLFWSDLSVQLMVMRDSYLRSPHLIHHQVLDQAKVEFAVLVELVHEGKLAHAIWTVHVVSLLVVADHRRHHLLELE